MAKSIFARHEDPSGAIDGDLREAEPNVDGATYTHNTDGGSIAAARNPYLAG